MRIVLKRSITKETFLKISEGSFGIVLCFVFWFFSAINFMLNLKTILGYSKKRSQPFDILILFRTGEISAVEFLYL